MLDMDRRLGPWRLRVWGLGLNLVGNALALFGIARLMRGGAPWLLVLGALITLACIIALAAPSRGGTPDQLSRGGTPDQPRR